MLQDGYLSWAPKFQMPQISVYYKNAGRLTSFPLLTNKKETVFYTLCTKTVAGLLCWLNAVAAALAQPECSVVSAVWTNGAFTILFLFKLSSQDLKCFCR